MYNFNGKINYLQIKFYLEKLNFINKTLPKFINNINKI